jgi:hypothetical protein
VVLNLELLKIAKANNRLSEYEIRIKSYGEV